MKKCIILVLLFFFQNSAPKKNVTDIKQKVRDIKLLVKAAVKFLETHQINVACHTFSKNPSWRKGDLSVMLIKDDGTIYTNPDDEYSLWQNLTDFDEPKVKTLLEEMLHRGEEGGGWVFYPWQNNLKYAYVKQVQKGNEKFYVTVGFFPQDKEFETEHLVNSVVHRIKDTSIEKVVQEVGEELFHQGFTKISLFQEDGTCIASAENPEWVGKNMIDLKDQKGLPILRTALKVVEEKRSGWFAYRWRNAKKNTFVHRYKDPQTQMLYILMASYYPEIQRNMVPKFVKKAATYLMVNGLNQAIEAFNQEQEEFLQGSLEITVYDAQGKKLTDTYKGITVDQSVIEQLIKHADRDGFGLIFFQERFTERAMYVEKVTENNIPYYIGSMFDIIIKKKSTEIFVKDAVEHLLNTDTYTAFLDFINPQSKYVYGDQYIFVYDMDGRCLAHPDMNLINRNLIKITDQVGKFMIEELIDIARKRQRGWTDFALRNSTKYTYIQRIDKKEGKKEKSYIVGSGYWL